MDRSCFRHGRLQQSSLRRHRRSPGSPLRAWRGEHGGALVSVLLLTALLFSLGIFAIRNGQIELMIAGNDVQAKRALEVADAGISHAWSLLQQQDGSGLNEGADGFDDELSNGGTGGALAAVGSLKSLDGQLYRFSSFGGATTNDGYYVRVVDNLDETTGFADPLHDSDRRITLVSRGRVGRAQRTVEVVIERDPLFPCVLCGNLDFPIVPLDIALVGAIRTDSYNSNVAPYNAGTAGVNGHVFSNGDISLATDILGLLPINIRGNVTAAHSILQLGAITVTGAKTQFAPPVEFPPVAPCGPPYPPNEGLSGGLYNQTLGTLINVGLNDVITLEAGDYCFSTILMTGFSSLRVNGPVRIFVTGPSTIAGIVNTTNVPANLQVYSSVTNLIPAVPIVPGLGLTIVGVNAQTAMSVYAPNAIVTFAGVNDFYGAIVGGMIPNVGIGRMHYDDALLNPRLRRLNWREARNYLPG